ncbi:hypothetical protein M0R04_16655 [Candidatus Dojkabacteria bacterium]|nr:hypothetical protein [Candidatus Dojkabacteria bacterium]
MSTESIFNSGTPATETPPVVSPSTTTSTIPPEVAEFVGTGKKYATLEEALKSVPHAQKLIPSLQEELANVKAELEKRRTTEAILEELRSSGIQSPATPAQASLTPEAVQSLITQTLGQQQIKEREAQNEASVISSFTAKFGTQAEVEYKRIAVESGLTIQEINKLSKTSPTLVLKLAGLDNKKTTQVVNKPTSTINTEAFNSQQVDPNLSARVKAGASTKDLLNGWKIAGQKVGKTY